jgi:hypothetical protein
MVRSMGWLAVLTGAVLGFSPALLDAQERDGSEGGGEHGDLPLEPGRTVAIDLTEGSWISVDVSPTAARWCSTTWATSSPFPSRGARPRSSPPAWRSTRSRASRPTARGWRSRPTGTAARTSGPSALDRRHHPGLARRGEPGRSAGLVSRRPYLVATFGSGRSATVAIPTSGCGTSTAGRASTSSRATVSARRSGPTFSPDGRWIWFAQRTGTGDWDYNAQLPLYEIRAYDRETGGARPGGGATAARSGPRSPRMVALLVYGTRHEAETGLRVRELESGAERWLAYPVQHDDQESRATLDVLPGMAFTPDSRHVVASYGGRIWRIPVDGGAAQEIPFRVRFDLAIGPGGRLRLPDRGHRDVHGPPDPRRGTLAGRHPARLHGAQPPVRRRRRREQPTRLAEMPGARQHMPTWSPDGRHVAFVTWEGEEGHVYRVSRGWGAEPQRISDRPAFYTEPVWSPDGDRIVLLRGHARAFLENTGAGAGSSADELIWLPAGGGLRRSSCPGGTVAARTSPAAPSASGCSAPRTNSCPSGGTVPRRRSTCGCAESA